uniref:NGFI-A-binding protein homolog (inferred by orthology to a D. melanogaster protein) n=1 Tax=Anisakis simplex TaxID=6269 RepID=A0A0M3KIA0_ANISI
LHDVVPIACTSTTSTVGATANVLAGDLLTSLVACAPPAHTSGGGGAGPTSSSSCTAGGGAGAHGSGACSSGGGGGGGGAGALGSSASFHTGCSGSGAGALGAASVGSNSGDLAAALSTTVAATTLASLFTGVGYSSPQLNHCASSAAGMAPNSPFVGASPLSTSPSTMASALLDTCGMAADFEQLGAGTLMSETPTLTETQIGRLAQCSLKLIERLPQLEPKLIQNKKKISRDLLEVMQLPLGSPQRLQEYRKYSAIYGRFDAKRKPDKPLTLHEVSVNEAAAQLCLRQPALLTRRDELFPLARQVRNFSKYSKKFF